jgi:arsenate reductase-like glutaredoxin family protein
VDLNKGITVEQLDQLIGERDYTLFLNPKNEMYRERDMKNKPPVREEALKLIAKNPSLLKRPILMKGKRLLLGFKPEEWDQV